MANDILGYGNRVNVPNTEADGIKLTDVRVLRTDYDGTSDSVTFLRIKGAVTGMFLSTKIFRGDMMLCPDGTMAELATVEQSEEDIMPITPEDGRTIAEAILAQLCDNDLLPAIYAPRD